MTITALPTTRTRRPSRETPAVHGSSALAPARTAAPEPAQRIRPASTGAVSAAPAVAAPAGHVRAVPEGTEA
ncbi:MAG TPA: hypothetical protein VFM87_03505, partial [Agrococcus sp.]|nr:hypothetical protein [Agrococcus sp.]